MYGDEGGVHHGGDTGVMDSMMQSFFFYHSGPNMRRI
jgi:hypothetical protein